MKSGHIIFILLLLLFSQCKKEDELVYDENELVPVTIELSLNGSRSDFTNLFPFGEINWGGSSNVEHVYLAIPKTLLHYDLGWQKTMIYGGLYEMTAELDEPTDRLVFSAMLPQNLLYGGRSDCILYYFGSNGQGLDGTNVTNIYDNYNYGLVIGKTISFRNQNGSIDDLSQYHIASAPVTVNRVRDSEGKTIRYDLVLDDLDNLMSFAMLDLSGETELGSTTTLFNSCTIRWLEDKFVEIYEVEEEDYLPIENIDVTDNVGEKSVIALLPTDGPVTLECGKGTYTFEDGIVANQIYVGRNGQTIEDVLPLEWEKP